ncbi:MAG TPA: deoxyribonuclease IV [Patescibacteria group bacterium]|nr:deoxyribonuclease IV [Patescibacteria group bacterium]
MKFGAHVSIAGGLVNAPARSKEIGGEVFQMFSRSPRGGSAPKLTSEVVKQFKAEMKKNHQAEAYIHTPYYINLASTNNRIRYGSISVIREELERASSLGVKYVMTHLGSANDLSRHRAIKEVALGLKKILDGYAGSAIFLMENSAGSGNVVGNEFEELGAIIKGVPRQARDRLAVCFDTCHAFASGYDLRDKKSLNQTLAQFDKIIGLPRLKLIHLNDSKTDLGGHIDRHEHIGQGKIGLEGFKQIVNHPQLKKINLILETPVDEQGDHSTDLKIIKKLKRK